MCEKDSLACRGAAAGCWPSGRDEIALVSFGALEQQASSSDDRDGARRRAMRAAELCPRSPRPAPRLPQPARKG
ncbi:hypothetical protein PsYK624_007200 [Phanerochaete sordida]|uniref:Uncharacterized protein n=1 Tax=Phanerochaete sordida TaxID=48140 RepID=A0A9P3FYI8_9APHY|nr:hypothetical protein PsYK624_007200 [Phanerochaete sordida]